MGDLDKAGKKGRSICGPEFCLELLFGPANAKHSSTASDDDVQIDELFWNLYIDLFHRYHIGSCTFSFSEKKKKYLNHISSF